jgi:hypothetical protein
MDPSQAKIRTKPGGTRPTRRSQWRRSKNWMILLSLGAAAGVAVLAGVVPELLSHTSSASVTEPALVSSPTGTIAESDAPICKRLTFDNKGQVVQDAVPCDGSIRDARGQPLPVGTIRRLDAISKSFSGTVDRPGLAFAFGC